MGYLLTLQAQQDIDDITDYTLVNHGERQAERYLDDLHEKLEQISSNILLGKYREDIETGIYSCLYEQHTIFYRDKGNNIVILRILHQSRDVQRAFEIER